MRHTILLIGTTLALGMASMAWADTKTDDSTNTYTDSSQYNEKLHQKPVANDANSGADMSTTKQQDTHKQQKHDKKAKPDTAAPNDKGY